jgi:L-type amino acid transporter 9
LKRIIKHQTNLSSIDHIVGTGIFSTLSSITSSVGSVCAALFLGTLGALLAFAGLCVWLEFG